MTTPRPAPIPDAVLEVLVCPVGGGSLVQEETPTGRALRCASGHAFDVARQGYVNLRTGSAPAGTADTADMVAARDEFLGQGHYAPLADAVTRSIARSSQASASASAPMIVDVGAGTGYYLRHALDVLDRGPADTGIGGAEVQAYGIAMDVSAYALRRAARAHPRAAAVGADAWRRLPLRDGSVSALLDVFAPRNADEFHRVLRPDGVLVVVTPTTDHLAELIDRFEDSGMLSVDESKDERVERALGERFALESRDELTFSLALVPDDVGHLIRMGPSAHHVSEVPLRETLTALAAEDARTDVTVAVTVSSFRPHA